MSDLEKVDEKIKQAMIQEDLASSKEEKKVITSLLSILRKKRSRLAAK